MKNFKLLLATTAILSTGLAMNADAANPTVDMDAEVELVVVNQFSADENIYFGRWIVPSNKSSASFSMNEDGLVIAQDSTITEMKHGSYGYTVGAPCDTLLLPEELAFDDTPRYTASAIMSGIHAALDDYTIHGCKIYADSLVISDTGENGIQSGTYKGFFTITAVLEPETESESGSVDNSTNP